MVVDNRRLLSSTPFLNPLDAESGVREASDGCQTKGEARARQRSQGIKQILELLSARCQWRCVVAQCSLAEVAVLPDAFLQMRFVGLRKDRWSLREPWRWFWFYHPGWCRLWRYIVSGPGKVPEDWLKRSVHCVLPQEDVCAGVGIFENKEFRKTMMPGDCRFYVAEDRFKIGDEIESRNGIC